MVRPKSLTPRDHAFQFKATEASLDRLRSYAIEHEMTMTEVVRHALREYMTNHP